MSRDILFVAILLCGQFAFGQSSLYGKYRGTGILFDSIRITYDLSLKQDGSYTMKYPRKDSLMTETGKWRRHDDEIRLKPKYSKAEKQYALQRTFVLNIEGDRLIWEPNINKQKLEKKISQNAMEKLTLVDKSEPLILYREN